MDYEHRSKAWVDAHYRNSEARGGVGWADLPARTEQAADRLDQLVREYGPPGGRMLEIGCGAGDISLLLAPRGLFDEIRGVDISEAAITWANRPPPSRRANSPVRNTVNAPATAGKNRSPLSDSPNNHTENRAIHGTNGAWSTYPKSKCRPQATK